MHHTSILKPFGRQSGLLTKCLIEGTPRNESAMQRKLHQRNLPREQDLLGMLHPVAVEQRAEITAVVAVHHTGEVGSIRAVY